MGTKSNRKAGDEAEDFACNFLIEKGWEIIDRNYYAGHFEVDIIARENTTIVFLEVKMRSSKAFGSPVEFVSEAKVERIFSVAEHWVHENNMHNSPLRFDVIAILKKSSGFELTHYADAYR